MPHHNRGGRTSLALCFRRTLFAAPAVSNVGTSRLFTDGMKSEPSEILLDCIEGLPGGDLGLQMRG